MLAHTLRRPSRWRTIALISATTKTNFSAFI
jgi:hypothetical protein